MVCSQSAFSKMNFLTVPHLYLFFPLVSSRMSVTPDEPTLTSRNANFDILPGSRVSQMAKNYTTALAAMTSQGLMPM
jgi:hypothetical protein